MRLAIGLASLVKVRRGYFPTIVLAHCAFAVSRVTCRRMQRTYAYGTRGWARYGKGDVTGAIEDCKRAVEYFGTNSFAVAYDEGLIDFMKGDYEKAAVSWEKAVQHDATLMHELQPWIEKAKVKLQNNKP